MKNRHEYNKEYIGSSDIATLILVGPDDCRGLRLRALKFGGDGSYHAYVGDKDIEIPDFYHLEARFYHWLKIYDDEELVKEYNGTLIEVYRAKEMGCIIKIIQPEENGKDEASWQF